MEEIKVNGLRWNNLQLQIMDMDQIVWGINKVMGMVVIMKSGCNFKEPLNNINNENTKPHIMLAWVNQRLQTLFKYSNNKSNKNQHILNIITIYWISSKKITFGKLINNNLINQQIKN